MHTAAGGSAIGAAPKPAAGGAGAAPEQGGSSNRTKGTSSSCASWPSPGRDGSPMLRGRVTCGCYHMVRERYVCVSPLAAAAQLLRSNAESQAYWSMRIRIHMGRCRARIGAADIHLEELIAGERRRVMAAGPSEHVCSFPRADAGLRLIVSWTAATPSMDHRQGIPCHVKGVSSSGSMRDMHICALPSSSLSVRNEDP